MDHCIELPGLGVPAAAPPPNCRRAMLASTRCGDAPGKLGEAGFRVIDSSQADTDKMVRSELQRWGGIVKATGFKGDN